MSKFNSEEFLKSRKRAKAYEGGTHGGAFVEREAEQYPRLASLLAVDVLDGSARETTTVLLFVEGDKLKACFNDRQEALSGFVTLDGLELVAEQLEEALADDKVDWRPSKRK